MITQCIYITPCIALYTLDISLMVKNICISLEDIDKQKNSRDRITCYMEERNIQTTRLL